jgi:uncharacterized iron-regulated protein
MQSKRPDRITSVWSLLALAGLVGCSAALQPETDEDIAHPLEGQIWDVRAGQFVDYRDLLADAAKARHVLLGEIHINPEHHRIQARIIEDLAAGGQPPALVFEIFEQDQQEELDRAISAPGATTANVAAATGIRESGWDWDSYEPLVGLALEYGMPVGAGNAPREQVNQVAMGGLETIPAHRLDALGISSPLPAPGLAALSETIVASHCGHVFGEMTGRLIAAQRLRDATMADVMISSEPARTILVTGSGHARRDYGVPYYLLAREPSADVLSIGLREVSEQSDQPADYVDQLDGMDAPFDFLWFTSATVSEDPCEQFRESFEKFHGDATSDM